MGKAINSFIDIFSYAALFIPCSLALNSIIINNNLDIKSFINNFITVGIGVITITTKHYITEFVKKLDIKLNLEKFWDFFKIKKTSTVKKFNDFSNDEQINEIDTLSESQKYLQQIENEK